MNSLICASWRFRKNIRLSVVENVVLPSVRPIYNNEIPSQQDNCPIHTATRLLHESKIIT